MQNINLNTEKRTNFYKEIQEYQRHKNRAKNAQNGLKQVKTNDRPPSDATESQRLEYLIPKQWHKVTEKGTFTNYYFVKIKKFLEAHLHCENCDINRIIKEFGKYLKEKGGDK